MSVLAHRLLVVGVCCFAVAGRADDGSEAADTKFAAPVVHRPLGPDKIPDSLPGRWKVSLCITTRGHCWIRYENVETGEIHSVSRYHLLVGGWPDPKRFRWHYPPTTKTGLYMDREQSIEHRRKDDQYLLLSTVIDDPVIYKGEDARGHGMIVNNCVTHTRDAWHFYTGEWYDLPPAHAPADLRRAVLIKHPEVYRREEAVAAKKKASRPNQEQAAK